VSISAIINAANIAAAPSNHYGFVHFSDPSYLVPH